MESLKLKLYITRLKLAFQELRREKPISIGMITKFLTKR
jgi:hypothetical protein